MSESSIAAGVRRVEALTGSAAAVNIQEETALLSNAAGLLKAPKTDLLERIERLLQEQRELEQQLQQLKSQHALGNVDALVKDATLVEDVRVVASCVADTDRDGLRRLVDELKNRLESGVVALAAVTGNEVAFVVGVTSDLVKNRGLQAGKIISELTQLADGRGGGRPELAQGGGKNPSKANAAIAAASEIVGQQLKT
jgi:alanyl-tRNA synthetase